MTMLLAPTQSNAVNAAMAHYDEHLAAPLGALLDHAHSLLPLLENLSSAEKADINASTKDYTAKLEGQEPFIHPETLLTVASLARHMEGLKGFFEKLKAGETGLSTTESAAAELRWEPFDQFAASIRALQAALEQNTGRSGSWQELQLLTRAINEECETIRPSLTQDHDTLFSQALAAHRRQSLPEPVPGPRTARELPTDDIIMLYNRHIKRPLHDTLAAAEAFYNRLEQNPEAKTEINRLLKAYAQQCTLEDMKLCSPDELPGRIQDLQKLEDAFKAVTSNQGVINEAQRAAFMDSWQTVTDLRSPVRAMHAMLSGVNKTEHGDKPFTERNCVEPGKYDDLLELAGVITGNIFTLRKALAPLGKALEAQRGQQPQARIG